MPDDLDRVLAEREIVQLVSRSAQAQDSRQWDSYVELLDDSVLVNKPLNPELVRMSGREYVEMIRETLDAFDVTHHQLTNHVVWVDGNEASADVDVSAYHQLNDGDAAETITVGGRYHFTLNRTDRGWLIAGRSFSKRYHIGDIGLIERARRRAQAWSAPPAGTR